MDNQQEKAQPQSDRPSFFGLPPHWRVWSQLGGRFWGGVLCGVGIGFCVAAALVELELTTFQLTPRVALIVMVFGSIGQLIAFRAVGRTKQSEKNEPQNT